MPNAQRITSPYLPTGNPNTMNVVGQGNTPGSFVPYAGGELGSYFVYSGKTYVLVQCESGATAVSVGTVMFWKSRTAFTVTNVVANAVNGGTANAWRNEVAGIAQVAFTPNATNGNFICLLVSGSGITVLASAGTAGQVLIADVSANVGQALGIAVGTAPTYLTIGVVTTAVSGASCVADVNIANTLV